MACWLAWRCTLGTGCHTAGSKHGSLGQEDWNRPDDPHLALSTQGLETDELAISF
jgi:hypothetical protein